MALARAADEAKPALSGQDSSSVLQGLDEILAALDELEVLAAQIQALRSEPNDVVLARRDEELIQAVSQIESSGGDPASDDAVMRLIEDLNAEASVLKSRLLGPKADRTTELLKTVECFNTLGKTLLLNSELRESPGVAPRVLQINDRVGEVLAAVSRSFQEDVRSGSQPRRVAIPERVRHEVWRRDQGRCVDCGSRDRLEFDHIIPVIKGGSNTSRNLELRCEACNRRKGAVI